MPTYVALLRGINVSGQKPVPMADLKALFEKLGFKGAKTYIQTGNVAFTSAGGDKEKLAGTIEAGILKKFGFEVPVVIRTLEELRAALAGNPYAKKKPADNERVYITYLGGKPAKEALQSLEKHSDALDELKIVKSEVYILVRNGYGNSKLSNTFVEKKLGVKSTTRNLETTAKLIALAESL